MTAEIRVWRIQNDDHLHPVKSSKLDMEARLEDWIEEDISILSNDFLVIGLMLPPSSISKTMTTGNTWHECF